MSTKHNADPILETFERTAASYHSRDEFVERLASGEPMRIKYGVDATAPFLHIEHAVNLWMMRRLQEVGHKAVDRNGWRRSRSPDIY